jgi:hypothetical protein
MELTQHSVNTPEPVSTVSIHPDAYLAVSATLIIAAIGGIWSVFSKIFYEREKLSHNIGNIEKNLIELKATLDKINLQSTFSQTLNQKDTEQFREYIIKRIDDIEKELEELKAQLIEELTLKEE